MADVQQHVVVKKEVPAEQEEWSPSGDTSEPSHIKDEKEEFWTSQEEEQIQGMEEADLKFPFSSVPVKTDDDEVKPRFSQLQGASESPGSSSSEQVMEIEADGDDGGGLEPPSNFDPDRFLQPDTIQISHCSECETEDRDDGWRETRKPQSDLSTLNNNVVVINNLAKSHSFSECGRIFAQTETLQRHMRRHTGNKSFTCSVCKTGFCRKRLLDQHLRSHTGEKPFMCSICGKQLTQHHHLIGHMRCHSGEKPFSCSVCNKNFRWRGDVVSHMRIHTGEKPHSCPVCGRRFAQRSSLFTHSKSHKEEKPLSCVVCNRRFHLKTTLVNHMRTHTGEKPYNCTVCSKGFSQIGPLNRHMKIHTGEKPFSRDACGKRFRQQTHVRRHKCVVQSNSSP